MYVNDVIILVKLTDNMSANEFIHSFHKLAF